MHAFLVSILVGWGVAMPIGPINIEMMQRNLRFGLVYGITVGVGASVADLTYLFLLASSLLVFLQYPEVLKGISIIGAAILLWFAYQAFKKPAPSNEKKLTPASIWQCILSGYLMALFSPFNILFWGSLTTQMAMITKTHSDLFWAGLGIISGALSWVITLNMLIHFSRHRLKDRVVRLLNITGGLILVAFATYGLLHAFSISLALA